MPAPIALSADNAQTRFDKDAAPALEVDPGTVVAFETGDETYARLAGGETLEQIGMEQVNRVTGPVAVTGARPGDALSVEVLDVRIDRTWSAWMPDVGSLGHWTDTARVRELPIGDGTVAVNGSLAVPLRPSIGCVGVAPAAATGSTMGPAGPWGGNMDLRELAAGDAPAPGPGRGRAPLRRRPARGDGHGGADRRRLRVGGRGDGPARCRP